MSQKFNSVEEVIMNYEKINKELLEDAEKASDARVKDFVKKAEDEAAELLKSLGIE